MSEFDNYIYEYKVKVYDGDDKFFTHKKLCNVFECELFKMELIIS